MLTHRSAIDVHIGRKQQVFDLGSFSAVRRLQQNGSERFHSVIDP
jgi:hypothetical protein